MSDSDPKDPVGLPNVPDAHAADGDRPVTMGADDFMELQPTQPSEHVDNVNDFVPSTETMFEPQPARVALLRAHKRWHAIMIAGIVLVVLGVTGVALWLLRGRLGIG